jgi:diguanylate cyclase (GGDEF)-like protein
LFKERIGKDKDTYLPINVTVKGEIKEIAEGYNSMAGLIEHLREQATAKDEKITFMYSHERITGLLTRQAFEKEFTQFLKANQSVALIGLNIDEFERINEIYGYLAGDSIINETGRRLKESAAGFEIFARTSNGQFMMAKTGDKDKIEEALRILGKEFEKPFDTGKGEVKVSIKMGAAIYPRDGLLIEMLMANSDIAMFSARSGKNDCAYVFYETQMRERIHRTGMVMEALRGCIREKEIFLMYQPLYNLNNRSITGFEALIRIRSKQLGLLSPLEFIPIAESDPELINSLGNWVLAESCRFIRNLIDSKGFEGYISVNVSAFQLKSGNFAGDVLSMLEEYGVPACHLQLEITEQAIEGHVKEFSLIFEELRAHGIKISLDDFGGIRSSFYYLAHLPLDIIKVDQAFFMDLNSNNRVTQMNRTVIELAKRFDLRVSAERVETESDNDMLKAVGFDVAQGYYFSPPLMEENLMTLI